MNRTFTIDLVNDVLSQQNYSCLKCKKSFNSHRKWDFYHKDGRFDNKNKDNLIAVCNSCHKKILENQQIIDEKGHVIKGNESKNIISGQEFDTVGVVLSTTNTQNQDSKIKQDKSTQKLENEIEDHYTFNPKKMRNDEEYEIKLDGENFIIKKSSSTKRIESKENLES